MQGLHEDDRFHVADVEAVDHLARDTDCHGLEFPALVGETDDDVPEGQLPARILL